MALSPSSAWAAQYLLHIMDRPALFEPPAAGLVSEIVKVELDGLQLRAGCRRRAPRRTNSGACPCARSTAVSDALLTVKIRSPRAPNTYVDNGYSRPAGSSFVISSPAARRAQQPGAARLLGADFGPPHEERALGQVHIPLEGEQLTAATAAFDRGDDQPLHSPPHRSRMLLAS